MTYYYAYMHRKVYTSQTEKGNILFMQTYMKSNRKRWAQTNN